MRQIAARSRSSQQMKNARRAGSRNAPISIDGTRQRDTGDQIAEVLAHERIEILFYLQGILLQEPRNFPRVIGVKLSRSEGRAYAVRSPGALVNAGRQIASKSKRAQQRKGGFVRTVQIDRDRVHSIRGYSVPRPAIVSEPGQPINRAGPAGTSASYQCNECRGESVTNAPSSSASFSCRKGGKP